MNLRTLLVLGLLVALVAGVTLISHFSVTPPKKNTPGDDAPGRSEATGPSPSAAPPAGPPLVFKSARIFYDPSNPDVAYRSFPGFFEMGDTVHWVSFWFRNDKPYPVKVRVRERSCTSCTSAKIAMLPADAVDEQAKWAAAGAAATPAGPDLLAALGYAVAQAKYPWRGFDFDDPADYATVPAAEGGKPSLGVLALGFKASAIGPPKEVTATLEAVGAEERGYPYQFSVVFAPRPAFDLTPLNTIVGDMPEGSPPRTYDVFVYSSTRKQSELPAPILRADRDDPFLTIGPPVPITPAEADSLVRRALAEAKTLMRVESGYRVPVTVHRDRPGIAPDIGLFDRTAHVALPGSTAVSTTTFRGRITGLLTLEEGEKMDIGTYNAEYVRAKAFKIYTTKPDLELELDPAKCAPSFAQFALEPLPQVGGRKYWQVKVVVPAKTGRRPSWDGVAYLRTKGPNPATIRFPVTGNGVGR